jgi:hypothetical protein
MQCQGTPVRPHHIMFLFMVCLFGAVDFSLVQYQTHLGLSADTQGGVGAVADERGCATAAAAGV